MIWLSSLPARMKKINIIHRFFQTFKGSLLHIQSGRSSNSSKLSCMSFLPARMKRIQSKMRALEYSQHFSHYKTMETFPDAERAAYSVFPCLIWPKFKLIRNFMVVLVTYKNEEDPNKNEGARVLTTFFHYNPMGVMCW